jgi:FkbM family methyltransferase
MKTVSKFGKSFDVVESELNSKFWSDHYAGWENSTFDFIIPRLDKDKTFIDIGSWIGPISLVASQFSKQCICFEPDGIAHDEFKQNIELNNIKNIHLENAAVSIHPEIELGCDVLGQSITRDSCKTNVIKCKCFSIKDILDKYNLSEQDISVIKIDVEGHETELLKDKTLWDLNVPMHISFHPGWKEDRKAFFNSMTPFLEHKKIDVSNLEQLGNFFDLTIK